MAIKDKSELQEPITIDLTGPEGNAHYLLGVAGKLSKMLNKDEGAIQSRMMAGNYDNLLEVFDQEFGEYVTLYR